MSDTAENVKESATAVKEAPVPEAAPAAAQATLGENPLTNVNSMMKYISDISPILITGFLFMNTVFNYDLKALFWVGPLFIWLMVMRFVQSKLKNNELAKTDTTCSRLFGSYKSPCLSSFFIMYTLGYIAAPMPVYDDWNIIAILMFVMLFMMDAYAKTNAACSTRSGIAIGGIGGLLIGVFMYFAMSWAGLGKFLYYTTGNTNNVYCSKPKEQNFKCYVYKNGNIISTI
jgi:hypothetical protein